MKRLRGTSAGRSLDFDFASIDRPGAWDRLRRRTRCVQRALSCVLLAWLVLDPAVALGEKCPKDAGGWGYGPGWVVEPVGDLVVVASGRVLRVVDASQPSSLDVIGELTLPVLARFVAPVGSRWALVAGDPGGLWLVDLADSQNPLGIAVEQLTSATAVAVAGDYAYVVGQTTSGDDAEFRLTVLDISQLPATQLLGSLTAAGRVEDITATEGTAYVALASGGLLAVDASDPLQPSAVVVQPGGSGRSPTPVRVGLCYDLVVLSSYEYGGPDGWLQLDVFSPESLTEVASTAWLSHKVYDMECSGTNLVLAGLPSAVTVVDVSTSDLPIIGEYWSHAFDAVSAALVGDYAFLVEFFSGLRTIDVADLSAPSDIGRLGLPDPPQHMVLDDHYLYGASSAAGFVVIDVAEPAKPHLVGSIPALGSAYDLAVSGDDAFVAAYGEGVMILDVAVPEAPAAVGSIATSGDARQVVVRGSHLLVSSDILQVFDIAVPTQASQVASLDLSGRLFLADDQLLVGAADGLKIVDVSDPASPVLAGSYESDWQGPSSTVVALVEEGGVAYVATWPYASADGILHAIDITDPTAPAYLCSVDISVRPEQLVVGNGALLAVGGYRSVPGDRLFAFDLLAPDQPVNAGTYAFRERGRCDVNADPISFVASGKIGYLSLDDAWYTESTGIQVVDIGDPAQPRLAGTLPSPSSTTTVAIVNGVAITGGEYENDVRIFDLSHPREPREMGVVDVWNSESDLVASGNLLFTGGGSKMEIFDFSQPTRPLKIAEVNEECHGLAVQDAYAFAVADRTLKIFDVSEPNAPLEVGSFADLTGEGVEVAVAGDTVVVASYVEYAEAPGTDIRVLDVSSPLNPVDLGSGDFLGGPTAVEISGHDVFLTTTHWEEPDQYGWYVIDISASAQPTIVAAGTTTGNALDVKVFGHLAFISDDVDGVLVLDVTDPAAPVEAGRIDTPGWASAVAKAGRYMLVADGGGGLMTVDIMGCLRDGSEVPSAED